MLIQNDKILVIFQYLLAKYCNDSKITECCLQTAQATHKYLDVLKSKKKKKLRTFSFLQIYDAAKKAKKSLLKLTEHSELDSIITLKTWSFKLT